MGEGGEFVGRSTKLKKMMGGFKMIFVGGQNKSCMGGKYLTFVGGSK